MSTTTLFHPELPVRLQQLQKVLKQCQQSMESGRSSELYAFAWYEEKLSYVVEAGRTVNTSESKDKGIVLRILCDGVQYESASNNLKEEAIQELAAELRRTVDAKHPQAQQKSYLPTTWHQELAEGLPTELEQQIPPHATQDTPAHFAPSCTMDPEKITIADLLQRVHAYRDQALALANQVNPQLNGASCLADVQLMARFRMTYNIFVDREKTMSQALPISVIGGGGVTTTGQSLRVTKGGLGTLELIDMDEADFNDMAVVPQELSCAEKIKPGRYKVITGPAISGVIAHEAFGHTQEGDTWMKGRSIARDLHANKTRVGNEHATIMNNPAIFSMEGQQAGCNGSYFFDNEGQLARPQTILAQGYLSTPMTDLTSALELNAPRTANGKRESWRRPLMTRQTNTYFTPGDKTLEELITLVDEGFMAVAPRGGMEDPKGGSLTAGAAYFEEIKKGQLTGRKFIGPAGGHIELTDSVFDVLDRIEAKTGVTHADKTPAVKLGGCGKYHKELVDAGVGGPYILWSSINCG
ncbi:TldD/PmbA family protein [Reinekea sp. G2M2-21]|uniref:TldD/PmbA family protein n=1 Tax=Reinekea sp. G2M2-21 TaxID=2788942 RepID=UPI0018A974A1|nr:TldD/PmbA family protein [Reinekea sp. G2M2-21]